MASVTASKGVALKASTDKLSGSTTLTGTDNNGKTTTLATITASGSPTEGGPWMTAGSNNGWTLNVVYNSDGTATGRASGSYLGINSCGVDVKVDQPGRSRHRGKTRTKGKTGSRKAAKRPAGKKSKVAGRKKVPARRKKPSRR